ncbi:MAG: hypothetical protein KJ069_05540 [Anaerolineae bacterium]|nr:hypothetical protein [Anaerolineae bacterium]
MPYSLLAQSPITVQSDVLDDADYPNSVTFRLDVDGTAVITQAMLHYDVSKVSCLDAAADVPVEIEGGTLEWTWEMVRSGNPPPGTAVTWNWTLTDADGNTLTTPPQTHTFTDTRYNWRTVEADNLKLHWYEGNVGPNLLNAAVDGLERLESEMGIELQDEVNLFIYGDTADMRDAVLYIQDWAGGVAFSDYNVILMGIPPSLANTWGQDVVPHELAHLVVAQYGRSCVGGSRPNWLEEGLAVYAEGDTSPDIQADIERGLANNSFEPLRSLNGAFSAHGAEAGIAYSQSYSTVAYLLETYGREPLQQLVLTLAAGKNTDAALEEVYGFNVDGLELEWRAHLGLPARDIPPTPTAINPAAIATIVPEGLPTNLPTPPAAAATAVPVADTSSNNPGICNLGLVPLLLTGLFFARRRHHN